MKVVCIDNSNPLEFPIPKLRHLTLGKIYTVCIERKESYVIFDDINDKQSWYKWRFKTLNEFRDEKLKELGI